MRKERHILLIEDNPGDAELIRAILAKKEGSAFHLHVESRLDSAQQFLTGHRHGIDIVLLDLGLPDSQGVDSIEKIRVLFPFLPIVVITGNEDENVGIEAVKRGAQDYIFKGLIPEHYLTQIVEYAIYRQEYEYRLRQSEEKYRSIVENIGIGVAMIDNDGTIVETNSRMNEWFPDLDLKKGEKCYNTLRCLCQGNPDYDSCPVKRTFADGCSHRGTSQKGGDHIQDAFLPPKGRQREGQGRGAAQGGHFRADLRGGQAPPGPEDGIPGDPCRGRCPRF